MATQPRSARPWHRALQTIHLWVGLILCLPLAVLGITGAILVFEHELEDLFSAPTARTLAVGEPQSVAAILDTAKANAPQGLAPGMVTLPNEAGEPASVRLMAPGRSGPGGGGATMLVDPVSLAVLETSKPGGGGLMRQIFMLHANLLIPDRSGRDAVGWLGVAMLVLGVSGLVLWWPRPGRWKEALQVKRGARGVRLHRDLHGAVGIWTLAVFVVVSFSGVYIAFPQTLSAAVAMVSPTRDLRAAVKVEPVRGAEPAGPDQAVALALAAVPDGRVRAVGLPARPDQAYRITLVRPDARPGAPSVTAFVDPWTSRVVEVRDPRTYSAGETFVAWQRPLHAGQGLGWVWKVLVFLSGVLPPLFAVTGTAMWYLKRRNRRAKDAERAAARATV
ncbi:PepSY-associated TM helix domain-containing protein [Azospirillum rugosum]|uniref:Iron-regulated membrane protein n=1 Tax=Azospirillum rugosum TaxID=416170 RepID=A0ABS4SP04_9PROT|nr:PepSY-associated TM helix domain-containing protein [Azospirillum rugosum]MBP2293662.1 putative iron-regulated membrane protein [Azospirillum rugosum]MDQ0527207.1 putative iron-regulated membrane protein [Azospirillum rugosum]